MRSRKEYAAHTIELARKCIYRGSDPVRLAVAAMEADISDRRGLKQEWLIIDDDVKADIRKLWGEMFRQVFISDATAIREAEAAARADERGKCAEIARMGGMDVGDVISVPLGFDVPSWYDGLDIGTRGAAAAIEARGE